MANTSQFQRWAQATNYATTPLSLARQLRRAHALARYGIDSDVVEDRQTNQYRIHNHLRGNPNRYQPYNAQNLGYTPGVQEVTLPAQWADPLPAPNQAWITSRHIYTDDFSGEDLPNIMFRLEPYRDDFKMPNGDEIPVPMLFARDANGQRRRVRNARGAELRYFAFLPRYIANDVDGALLDLWSRLDPRLEMNDILMRMESNWSNWSGLKRESGPKRNALRMDRDRTFRDVVGLSHWGDSRLWPSKAQCKVVDKLDPYQICLNTTMIVDLVGQRLLKPVYDKEITTRTGYMDSGLLLDHFLQDTPNSMVPSLRMMATLGIRARLQELTFLLGRGTGVRTYLGLDEADEPVWWNDKKAGRKQAVGREIDEIDGLSHEEYMEMTFGDDTRIGWKERQYTRGLQL